jgi:hypothetical protein
VERVGPDNGIYMYYAHPAAPAAVDPAAIITPQVVPPHFPSSSNHNKLCGGGTHYQTKVCKTCLMYHTLSIPICNSLDFLTSSLAAHHIQKLCKISHLLLWLTLLMNFFQE